MRISMRKTEYMEIKRVIFVVYHKENSRTQSKHRTAVTLSEKAVEKVLLCENVEEPFSFLKILAK